MLLKSGVGLDCKEEFEEIASFYGSDMDCDLLENQRVTYKIIFKKFKQENVVLSDIMEMPGHSELLAKTFLILYPPFENSTTRIAIIRVALSSMYISNE